MKRTLVATFALLAAGSVAAQAIPESAYRRGEVEVLKPEPDPNQGPMYDVKVFRTAYAKANRPTVAVLWNRQFSDMLEQQTSTSTNITQANVGAVQRSVTAGPGFATGQASGAAVSNTRIDTNENKTQQAQRRGPVERVDLEMRGAFMRAISTAGVRLVDRNLVMRTTASDTRDKDKEEKLDSQMIETKALSKHAKLLMEVLNTPDPQSPTGWATFISIKSLSDGVVVMEGYFKGRPQKGAPSATPQFEPDPRGGFREVRAKVEDAGRLVAEQMLAELGEALTR